MKTTISGQPGRVYARFVRPTKWHPQSDYTSSCRHHVLLAVLRTSASSMSISSATLRTHSGGGSNRPNVSTVFMMKSRYPDVRRPHTQTAKINVTLYNRISRPSTLFRLSYKKTCLYSLFGLQLCHRIAMQLINMSSINTGRMLAYTWIKLTRKIILLKDYGFHY